MNFMTMCQALPDEKSVDEPNLTFCFFMVIFIYYLTNREDKLSVFFNKISTTVLLTAAFTGAPLLTRAATPTKAPVVVCCKKKITPKQRTSRPRPKYTPKAETLPLLKEPVFVPLCCDGVRFTIQTALGKRDNQMPIVGSTYKLTRQLPVVLSKCHSATCARLKQQNTR